MTLIPGINDAANQLAATGQLPGQVDIVLDDGAQLSLALVEVGPVALSFDRLDYTTASTAERTPDALRAWADRLAAKVTYLMEPLVVVEHDEDAGEVDVRSRAPSVRDGKRTYYELRLYKNGGLRLSRVVFHEADKRRETVPCPLTFETLERLVDDFASTARG